MVLPMFAIRKESQTTVLDSTGDPREIEVTGSGESAGKHREPTVLLQRTMNTRRESRSRNTNAKLLYPMEVGFRSHQERYRNGAPLTPVLSI